MHPFTHPFAIEQNGLNFESGQTSFVLAINVSGTLSTTVYAFISVTDVNESPNPDSYNFTVFENVTANTVRSSGIHQVVRNMLLLLQLCLGRAAVLPHPPRGAHAHRFTELVVLTARGVRAVAGVSVAIAGQRAWRLRRWALLSAG